MVQSFQLAEYLFTDNDGSSCYSEGDIIRNSFGHIIDPDSPEIEAFKAKWRISDLNELNIGTANAVIGAFRRAEFFAEQGQMEKVKKQLHTIKVQQPYSGMDYDNKRVHNILETAKIQQLENLKVNDRFLAALQQILIIFPMNLFAGLGIYSK